MEPDAPTPVEVEPGDPRLDEFRGIRDRELRGTLGLHAVEHELVVRRFLTAALRRRAHPIPPVLEPHALLVTPDSCGRLAGITAHFSALRIYRGTGEKALHEITGYTMHSGALGLGLGLRHEAGTIGELAACLARGARPARDVLVAMDGITQTDNVGAIFRNAASTATRSSRARTRRTP